MDLFLHSSCIIALCINPFATLMYDCLLVRRAVVRSYVTPQVETENQFYTLPDVIALCCVVLLGERIFSDSASVYLGYE